MNPNLLKPQRKNVKIDKKGRDIKEILKSTKLRSQLAIVTNSMVRFGLMKKATSIQ